jgi:putative DNA primase/helicase
MNLETNFSSNELRNITTLEICTNQPDEAEVKRLIAERKEAVVFRKPPTATVPKITTTSIDERNDSQTHPWQAMAPITTKLPGMPYPIEALPEVIRKAVQEVQDYTQTPIALVANSALVSLSTACQAHFDVARDDNLKAPVSLFFVTLAESGERKTTCDHFFSKTLLDYQVQVAKERAPEASKYKAEAAAWAAKEEGLKTGIKRASEGAKTAKSIDILERELQVLHQGKPQQPRIPSIVRTDDTSENLAYVLTYDWPSAGIISSEGGLLFGSRALKKDNVTATLALYNVLWDGGESRIGRKTGDSFTVRGARLSIGVQVQPEVMRNFLEGPESTARGIGFMARCLFSFPASTQGSRPYKTAPKQMTCLEAFNTLVRQLLDVEPKIEDGRLVTTTIPLSTDAKQIWIAFHDRIESQLAPGSKYETCRDIASKIADNASRIAAIFAATKGLPFTEIDSQSMMSACSVAEWHLHEALRYFGIETPSEKKISGTAKKLEDWLIQEAVKTSSLVIEKRKTMQYGPNSVKALALLTKAIEFLQIRNRVRFSIDKKTIELNPDLLPQPDNICTDQFGDD